MDEGADLSQRPSPTGDDAGGCALDAWDALPVAGAFRRNHVGSHGTSIGDPLSVLYTKLLSHHAIDCAYIASAGDRRHVDIGTPHLPNS
jgi:hypothetical protein